jgi:hypothetical protein
MFWWWCCAVEVFGFAAILDSGGCGVKELLVGL